MKKAITILDIANELGLSRNTVSKALNGGYVPEKTRKQVLDKAIEMNYKSMSNNIVEVVKKKIKNKKIFTFDLKNITI